MDAITLQAEEPADGESTRDSDPVGNAPHVAAQPTTDSPWPETLTAGTSCAVADVTHLGDDSSGSAHSIARPTERTSGSNDAASAASDPAQSSKRDSADEWFLYPPTAADYMAGRESGNHAESVRTSEAHR